MDITVDITLDKMKNEVDVATLKLLERNGVNITTIEDVTDQVKQRGWHVNILKDTVIPRRLKYTILLYDGKYKVIDSEEITINFIFN